MIKKTFILLALAMFAMLLSCGDDKVTPDKPDPQLQPIESGANLQVTARNVVTGEFVDAKVTLRTSPVQTQDIVSPGSATFKVDAGRYSLNVDAGSDYAPVEMTAVLFAQARGNVYIVRDTTITAPLYPMDAGLTGSLTYKNVNGKTVAAEGVTVRISFGTLEYVCRPTATSSTTEDCAYTTFVTKYVDAKTDKDGKYSFPTLPAVGTNYSIKTLPVTMKDGTSFPDLTLSTTSLLSGASTKNVDQNLNIVASEFRVVKYTESISETDAIVFEFNDQIRDSIAHNTVVISGNPAVTLTWGEKSLTINPVGKWDKSLEKYTVTLNRLESVKGELLSGNPSNQYDVYMEKPDLSKEVVKGLKIDTTGSHVVNSPSSTVNLIWESVDGATKYTVFAKKNGAEEYIEVGTVTTAHQTVTSTWVTETKGTFVFGSYDNVKGEWPKLDIDTYTFVVQASNSDLVNNGGSSNKFSSKTSLIGASTVDVTDVTAPTFESAFETGNNFYKILVQGAKPTDKFEYVRFNGYDSTGFEGSWGLAKKLNNADSIDIDISRIFFNEPMDTTYANLPKVTVSNLTFTGSSLVAAANVEKKLLFNFKWVSETELEIALVTSNGNKLEVGKEVRVLYSITGLKDKKGNAFDGTYGTGAEAAKGKKTVDFKFGLIVVEESGPCDLLTSETCKDFCDENATDATCVANACEIYGEGSPECNTYCAGNITAPVCFNYACGSGGIGWNSSNCKSHCGTPSNQSNSTCSYYWVCEVSPDSWECGTQCLERGNAGSEACNYKGDWTCDYYGYWYGYSYSSTACKSYCLNNPMKISNAFTMPCRTTNYDFDNDDYVNDVFGSVTNSPSGDFKSYCQGIYAGYLNNYSSMTAAYSYCGVFTQCVIDPGHSSCGSTTPTCNGSATDDCDEVCDGTSSNSAANTSCPMFFEELCNASVVGSDVNDARCDVHCMVDVTRGECKGNAGDIFGITPPANELFSYCTNYISASSTNTMDNLTTEVPACTATFNACSLFGSNDLECTAFCKTSVDNFFKSTACISKVADADEFCGNNWFGGTSANADEDVCGDGSTCTSGYTSDAGCLCYEDITGADNGIGFGSVLCTP